MPEHRRALVLGATGFLGGALVHTLLDRGLKVSALVRGKPQGSEFVRTRLFEKTSLAGGIIEDTSRLRQIIALHEIDCIYHCAAGATPSETHSLTEFVLQAVATSERKPSVVVPLAASAAIRFRAQPPARLNVAFVKLPELFGAGNLHLERFTAELFANAAKQEPLPVAYRDFGVLDVSSAADELANAAEICEQSTSATGHDLKAEPLATSRELYAAVKAEQSLRLVSESSKLQECVKATLEWYRTTAPRWRDRMSRPALKAVA